MKKLLFIFAFLLLCSSVCYAQTVKTTLTVREYQTVKSVTPAFLGINDTWTAGSLYTDSATSLTLSDNYKNTLHSCGIPVNLLRMAGADAHDFNWKDSLGPLQERANGSNLGLVEWIKFNKELNPDVELTFTLNIIEDSITDHKDLVRFLLLEPDDPNAVDENGFNWAQYRVDLGIKDPVNIKIFELGNEVYYDYVKGCDDKSAIDSADVSVGVEAYIADCKEIISAMRSVKSDITFSVVDFSYGEATKGNAQAWNSRIVAELYKDCAYITHHEYFFDYNFYWINSRLEDRLLTYIDKLSVSDSKKPRVYISEYGYWMDKSLDNKREGTNLSGTLTMAKYLNFLMNAPYVEYANVHVTNEGISSDDSWHSGWDLFRYYDDGNIYATVPTEMLKIFNEALENNVSSNNVVVSALSGSNNYWANFSDFPNSENTEVGLLNASAFKTNDGLNVLLVNSSDTVEHQLSVTFRSSFLSRKNYRLVEEVILTSDQLTDNNLPGSEHQVYTKRYTSNSTSALSQYTVPAKSIVLLKLVPTSNTTTTSLSEPIRFVGEHAVSNGNVYVGKNFGIQLSFYEDEAATEISDMDLYVINDSVSPVDFVASPQSYLTDVVYMDTSSVTRNYLYYDIVMSDTASDGRYYAIIGNLQEDAYTSVPFYYGSTPKTVSNLRVDSISAKNDHGSYAITYQAEADFTGEPIAVTMYQKNADGVIEPSIVYAGKLTSASKINETIEIPAASVAGEYVLELMWENQGRMESVTHEFTFEKVDELLSITKYPTDENFNAVTIDNIISAKTAYVTLQNNTDTMVKASVLIAEYGANGNLVAANFGKNDIPANSSSTTVEVQLSGLKPVEAGGYIKVFIWKDDNLSPQANVTYVK